MSILVTGAAGYIGSIVTERLLADGHDVIALDNLQQGHREALNSETHFIRADLGDLATLDDVFSHHQIDAVMHLAAECIVKYSMTDPKRYFHTNVVCGINLLNTMLKYGVDKLIFSSSAAVYGKPRSILITESTPEIPVNAYGGSKLMFETILRWYGLAYKLKSISLRYFNAAGASKHHGEHHEPETHLIPTVLKVALRKAPYVPIFGTDYETKDGTCIRDYVHVLDIANAHLQALNKIDSLGTKAYNLGSGRGYSVLEVVNTAKRVTGTDIPIASNPPRAGDPPVLLASSELAKAELSWEPEYPDLADIIASAWRWQNKFPNGYAS